MEDVEEWRPIKDYEDIYEISSKGRIFSKQRLVKRSSKPNDFRKEPAKEKKIFRNRDYSNSKQNRVELATKEGKKSEYSVIKLMYKAFVGPIPIGHNVILADSNLDNLTLANLKLINTSHKNALNRISENELKELINLKRKGMSYKKMQDKYKLSKTTLYSLIKKNSHFHPKNYQKIAIEKIINTSRCALWMDMGLGKTATTLEALDRLALTDRTIFPALIIAPLRVAKTTWPEELNKWDNFKHLRLTPVIGELNEREKALSIKSDLYTINYENLPWLINYFKADWPFKTVVVDESTRLKNLRFSTGSKLAAAFSKIAHKYVDRLIELTGTPSPNGLKDLWGQIWFWTLVNA